jgi:hypothetical protein
MQKLNECNDQSCVPKNTSLQGPGILIGKDLSIRRFETLSQADSAESECYASLTPEERLNILLELIGMYQCNQGENSQGFERVYRFSPTHPACAAVIRVAAATVAIANRFPIGLGAKAERPA